MLRIRFALALALAAAALPVVAAQEGPPQPGPEHAVLKELVGTFDFVSKFKMTPEQPWQETKGTEINELILGGFWLSSRLTGDFLGMAFEGRTMLGYDTFKKKYVSTWVDNFGPWMLSTEGSYDAKAKTMSLAGEGFEPMQNRMVRVRMVTEIKDADHHVFSYYTTAPDGKEWKSMEISYARAPKK